ncbi:MAG: methyltransferase domain-containing protein [Bacillota bacterium]|nr:methyltransferase domain-containing protein [Bacillota bacterium]
MTNQIKCACSNFYESDAVKYLLGHSFHPGGLALTQKMGEAVGLKSGHNLLDVASGQGTSACFLARTFGCSATGVDLSKKNLELARSRARQEGIEDKVSFVPGDAESLPFAEKQFDVVVSECAFCTFPSKEIAAREKFRVLKPGGHLGFTDMAVDQQRLPEEMKDMLFHAACVADARTVEEYHQILGDAGFIHLTAVDCREALSQMLADIKQRLFMAELAVGLKKLHLGDIDFAKGKSWLALGEKLLYEGVISYVLITGQRPE